MKVVVNKCFGGYGLSKEAYQFLGIEWDGYGYALSGDNERTNPRLVECVETLGDKANGSYASLRVVEIPDDISWEISDCDGWETVEEIHRSW